MDDLDYDRIGGVKVIHLIWYKYIGKDIIEAKCPVCQTNTITKDTFCQYEVYCPNEIINAAPICYTCKSSMGKFENIWEYTQKKYSRYPVFPALPEPFVILNERHNIWNEYIGTDIINAMCPVCQTTTITSVNFGEFKTTSPKNAVLRCIVPVCMKCKLYMGTTKNIWEYTQTFYMRSPVFPALSEPPVIDVTLPSVNANNK